MKGFLVMDHVIDCLSIELNARPLLRYEWEYVEFFVISFPEV